MDGLGDLADEHRLLDGVRGRGLMVGLELYEPAVGKRFSRENLTAALAGLLLDRHGVLTAYTINDPNVPRFEPPLIVEESRVDRAVDAADELCSNHANFPSAVVALLETVARSRLGR